MANPVLSANVYDFPTVDTAYQKTGFVVPAGVKCIIGVILNRNFGGTAVHVPTLALNSVLMTQEFSNNAGYGYDTINSFVFTKRSNAPGTFPLDITIDPQTRGCVLYMLCLDRVIDSGTIIKTPVAQRTLAVGTNSDTITFSVAAAADDLVVVAEAISENTTVVSFTGAGFTAVGSGNYTATGFFTANFRYLADPVAGPIAATTQFGKSVRNIGGLMFCVQLGVGTGGYIDLSSNMPFGVDLTGIAEPPAGSGAGASLADASYMVGAKQWTDLVLLESASASATRRLLTVGTSGGLTIDQVAAGAVGTNVWRATYQLDDGTVTLETASGSQTTELQHLALLASPGAHAIYLDGVKSQSSAVGVAKVGGLVITGTGERIGDHPAASPAHYSGKVGRWMRVNRALSPRQIRLLALSELDPQLVFGIGSEDSSLDATRSHVARPQTIVLNGQSEYAIELSIFDPSNSRPELTGVQQPDTGAVEVAGPRSLIYRPPLGWTGKTRFTYTLSAGAKFSTGAVAVVQTAPA